MSEHTYRDCDNPWECEQHQTYVIHNSVDCLDPRECCKFHDDVNAKPQSDKGGKMIGMKIIREMSKEDMIDELLAGQRVIFGEQTLETLKHYVIQSRTVFTQRSLIKEANLDCIQEIPGFFGDGNDDSPLT